MNETHNDITGVYKEAVNIHNALDKELKKISDEITEKMEEVIKPLQAKQKEVFDKITDAREKYLVAQKNLHDSIMGVK